MAGRTPQEAVAGFLAPLKAVVGCITSEGFVTRYSERDGYQLAASFQDDFAIVTRRNGQSLKLEFAHGYTLSQVQGERGLWTASTTEYIYEVADESDALIATFHWHPVSRLAGDEMRWPHVHAYGARDNLTLHKLHLPTGRVSVEAVVRFLIEDLEVVPRRDDWHDVLDRHEEAFRRSRTWA